MFEIHLFLILNKYLNKNNKFGATEKYIKKIEFFKKI